jgi:hypothetical protein
MSATVSSPTRQRWLTRLLSGQPHQVIGTPDDPYLLRWLITPANGYCQVYGHHFLRSDDPTPHDHPWHFISIVLRGRYFEETPGGCGRWRTPGHGTWRFDAPPIPTESCSPRVSAAARGRAPP